jgi:hypothetical protein
MAWIESHQELARHPKTKKFARKLGVSNPTAIGHLHYLWWWALDYAQDGDLSSFEIEDIADAMDWPYEEASNLINALIESEFVDKDGERLLLHDWYDYAGRLVDKREQNKERKRKSRAKKSVADDGHAVVTRDGNVTDQSGSSDTNSGHGATEPNPTEPNHTQHNSTEPDRPPANTAPVSDSENVKDKLFELIRSCDIKKYTIYDLDVISSYIGVVDVEVIETAIKKGSGKASIQYAISTLKGFVSDGKTKKEHVIERPVVQKKSSPFQSGYGKSGKPHIPIVSEEVKNDPISPEKLEELRKLARNLDGKE